jgi:DNA end-binding protein Ku
MVPHDPDLGEVDRADLVKGYEYERDRYFVITDEDLDQVKIESSETIAIERFVPTTSTRSTSTHPTT